MLEKVKTLTRGDKDKNINLSVSELRLMQLILTDNKDISLFLPPDFTRKLEATRKNGEEEIFQYEKAFLVRKAIVLLLESLELTTNEEKLSYLDKFQRETKIYEVKDLVNTIAYLYYKNLLAISNKNSEIFGLLESAKESILSKAY